MDNGHAGKTLVIGFGNPLRGDDGVAWHILGQLLDTGYGEDESVVLTHQLTPELAETVSQAANVIFVDAAEGSLPGVIADFPVKAEPDSTSFTFHELTPSGLLALAGRLYGPPPPAVMVTVTGQSFDPSEMLSQPVLAALPQAAERVRSLIRSAH